MSFVGLKLAFHYNTLLKKICQSCHDDGIEHVDLQKESIAHMEPIERDTLDQGNSGNKLCIVSILIASIADSQRMINRQMKSIYVGANLIMESASKLSMIAG